MTRKERTQTRSAREADRRFEELVQSVSSILIGSAHPDIDRALECVLAQIGEYLHIDHATVWEYDSVETTGEFRVLCGWVAPGSAALPGIVKHDSFPWIADELRSGRVVMFSDRSELPEEAATDRRTFEKIGVRAHLSMPLAVGDHTVGALSLGVLGRRRNWSDVPIDRLRVVMDAISNALDRKATHNKLRLSETRYKSLLGEGRALELEHLYERAPIGMCVTDENHRYLRINQRLCDINGKPMDEHVGHFLHEVIPDLADQIVPMFQGVIDTGEPVLDYEVRGGTLRYPGEERVFLGSHFPLISTSGKVQYVHTMVRDITDQKRAEAGLQRSKNQLEERVRVRTEELVRLTEELKAEVIQRVRAQEVASQQQTELAHVSRVWLMGELSASIAHELNQPLAAVLMNAQVALRLIEKEKPDLEELHEILDDIVADDMRAGQVIRRLRALLKKAPAVRESVQLDELVSNVLPLIRSDALSANINITVESAPDLPPVEVDPVQIQQVVMNLLVNAIEGIRGSELEGGDIEVEISLAGKEDVLIIVGDNGPGIPAKETSQVFEPFVTTKTEGLGMGLAICKSIVAAHGGTISVESSVSRGCRFSFVLPLRQPAAS